MAKAQYKIGQLAKYEGEDAQGMGEITEVITTRGGFQYSIEGTEEGVRVAEAAITAVFVPKMKRAPQAKKSKSASRSKTKPLPEEKNALAS